ncbi:hypothetical protein OV207_19875 [Corallococcus sp. BB11-1]|uniref:hypothetical protein n=1 Tax=Corallococcus sp. BB11-1 TaxID=2996783 RepID=UPI00226E565F|nr:hypothetical protein [Corallococcus sp. BB11-1]MCY1033720.1 hypothetical protein [Corallococcus sp. BB11-1]
MMSIVVKNGGAPLVGEVEALALVDNFHLYRMGCVKRFLVVFPDEGETSVVMVAEYAGGFELTITLLGVRQLRVPEINEYPMRLPELEVADVRGDGLERVSYSVQDFGGGGFKCLCRDVKLKLMTTGQAGSMS